MHRGPAAVCAVLLQRAAGVSVVLGGHDFGSVGKEPGTCCGAPPLMTPAARLIPIAALSYAECLNTRAAAVLAAAAAAAQHLLKAARMVEAMGICDAIDINFGCPQRIAKRGGYGAFLMDDLPKVEAMVRGLAQVRGRGR